MNTLKWLGTSLGIAGAFLVALNIPISGYGFIPFLGSSLIWGFVGSHQNDWPLLWINCAFTTLNLLGIWRWLL